MPIKQIKGVIYMNNALKEALKEFARVLISGLVPVVITITTMIAGGINQVTGAIIIPWMLIRAFVLLQFLTILGTAIARAADKYQHEYNSETKTHEDGKSMGIIPF